MKEKRRLKKVIPMTADLWDCLETIQKLSKNALIKNATDAIIFCIQRTEKALKEGKQ